jgi:hypothetical protein
VVGQVAGLVSQLLALVGAAFAFFVREVGSRDAAERHRSLAGAPTKEWLYLHLPLISIAFFAAVCNYPPNYPPRNRPGA